MRQILLAVLLATSATSVWAQEILEEQQPVEEQEIVAEEASEAESNDEKPNGNGVDSPKTMSGMSILGNEEAPKSLVIIPWKSSRLGDEISLSDTLDDRARPVDKDVFLRELRFHEIRSGEQT
jgi:hypothetical protein